MDIEEFFGKDVDFIQVLAFSFKLGVIVDNVEAVVRVSEMCRLEVE